MRFVTATLGLASVLPFAHTSNAAIIAGTIKTEAGRPEIGAMFTVWNKAPDRKETVYTDADGSFAIKTDFGGELNVRARLANFADATAQIDIGVDEAKTIDLVVKHFATPQKESDALTASAHTEMPRWKNDAQHAPFVVYNLPHSGFWRWMSDMLLPTVMNAAGWWPDHSDDRRARRERRPSSQDSGLLRQIRLRPERRLRRYRPRRR